MNILLRVKKKKKVLIRTRYLLDMDFKANQSFLQQVECSAKSNRDILFTFFTNFGLEGVDASCQSYSSTFCLILSYRTPWGETGQKRRPRLSENWRKGRATL